MESDRPASYLGSRLLPFGIVALNQISKSGGILKGQGQAVAGLDEAIEHINRYGSHHSDAIVTGRPAAGDKFLREVDSAAVYVNASTRFTDGFEFGLGAEIGISTQKLHARGPMGLVELTSAKFVVRGTGNIRK